MYTHELVGTWTSKAYLRNGSWRACGKRTYGPTLRFNADGTGKAIMKKLTHTNTEHFLWDVIDGSICCISDDVLLFICDPIPGLDGTLNVISAPEYKLLRIDYIYEKA